MITKYIKYAIKDCKNKDYEVMFEHPDKRLKCSCTYSYSIKGKDYYIYREYYEEHNFFSLASLPTEEISASIMKFLSTPVEELINPILL